MRGLGGGLQGKDKESKGEVGRKEGAGGYQYLRARREWRRWGTVKFLLSGLLLKRKGEEKKSRVPGVSKLALSPPVLKSN